MTGDESGRGNGGGASGDDWDMTGYEDKATQYYLIPPMVLSRMYDDFSPLVGPKKTRQILNSSGYRCGEKMALGLDIDTSDRQLMEGALQELLIQLGLGVLKLEEYTSDRVVITCGDSNEAKGMGERPHPSCNFTTGYIRGLLEILMSVTFDTTEEECISVGADRCRYVFTRPD